MAPPLAGIDAIVLAGGRGTRLRAVVPDRQKVTAEVAGEPFLSRVIRWLADAGAARVVLAAGHRSADVRALAVPGGSGPAISVSVEPAPLDTGGAARLALAQTDSDPVLVLNGDSFAAIDLLAFRTFFSERHAQVSMALVQRPDRARYGAVAVDSHGAVVSFREKPEASAAGGAINAGIYLFRRSALAAIPLGRPCSLERDVFPQLISRGLYAMIFTADFIDIGTPQSLEAAERFFRAGDPHRDH